MKALIFISIVGNLYWFSQVENSSNNPPVLTILEEKCNVCHQKKKSVVFTEGNMETWAAKIHKQVFVKNRMPKGKKFPLTIEEYDILESWLADLNIPEK
ncbi:MAG: putative membrane protein [Paraglaciecola sp.]